MKALFCTRRGKGRKKRKREGRGMVKVKEKRIEKGMGQETVEGKGDI